MSLPFRPSASSLPQYVVSRHPVKRGIPISNRLLRFRRSAIIILLLALFSLWLYVPRRAALSSRPAPRYPAPHRMTTLSSTTSQLPLQPDDLLTLADPLASNEATTVSVAAYGNHVPTDRRLEAITAWESSSFDLAAVDDLVKRLPIVVFSKTTCPHSARAKKILSSMDLSPPPYIVEVDRLPSPEKMKAILIEKSNHNTLYVVFLSCTSTLFSY